MAFVDKLLVAAVNHLIGDQEWALERLRPFAGAQVAIDAGAIALRLAIDGRGSFHAAAGDGEPAVRITLPADLPARLLGDRGNLFAAARLAGSADLAENLAFVFRNLEWDAEADLARVVGDIPARRLVRLAGGVFGQLRAAGERTLENLAEYATEEAPLIAPRRDVAAFCSEVDRLRDDLARLEKRLARL